MGGGMGGAKFNTVAMRPPSTGDRSLPNNWKAGAKDDCKYTYIILSNKCTFIYTMIDGLQTSNTSCLPKNPKQTVKT